MLFVAIASAVLVTVLGAARDPTKVCLPEVFQTFIFDFKNDITGLAAFDFPNDVLSVRNSHNIRTVFNLTDHSAVAINDTNGRCYKLPNSVRYQTLATRCFPANAVKLSNMTTYVGLGSSEIEFEDWQLQVPGVGTITTAVTTTTPVIPVISQYVSEDGKDREIIFYFNAKTSVDDPDIFNVPDVCTPITVVG